MDHIGIDVHKKESQICILAEGGELLERRVPTQGRRFAEELGARPHARILLESATEIIRRARSQTRFMMAKRFIRPPP